MDRRDRGGYRFPHVSLAAGSRRSKCSLRSRSAQRGRIAPAPRCGRRSDTESAADKTSERPAAGGQSWPGDDLRVRFVIRARPRSKRRAARLARRGAGGPGCLRVGQDGGLALENSSVRAARRSRQIPGKGAGKSGACATSLLRLQPCQSPRFGMRFRISRNWSEARWPPGSWIRSHPTATKTPVRKVLRKLSAADRNWIRVKCAR